MAVRFDAAGDSLSRSTSVPNIRSFSVCGWAVAVVDNGAVPQPIVAMLDGALQDGIALYWDNGFGNLELIVANAGGIFDNSILATSPATGQTFAWFVTCSGNGTNTVTAGYRLPGSNTWTTVTADMGAAVADNATITFADVASAQSFNGRIWNVKAWDTALTADQLLIESRFERMVFPANRNFHWPLYRHDALFDISGNGRSPTSGGTLGTEDAWSGLWKPSATEVLGTATPAPTGAFATTLAGGTLAATGTVANPGAFATTLAGGTLAALGQVGANASGAFATTLADDTISAAGLTVNPGAFSTTLAGATFAASGSVLNPGTFATTLADDVLAAAGVVGGAPSGTFAATLAGVTFGASGLVVDFGSYNTTLADATLAALGQVGTNASGTFAGALAGDALAASGLVVSPGVFAAALSDAVFAASGAVGNPGAFSTTLAGATMTAFGTHGTPAAGAALNGRLNLGLTLGL